MDSQDGCITSGPTADEDFIACVAKWIESAGEVFVHLRFSHAAGVRRYSFCRTAGDFRTLVDEVPTATDVIVFRQPQLKLRGTVTDEFTSKVLDTIAEGTECLLVHFDSHSDELMFAGSVVESPDELLEELLDLTDARVAVGPEPPWHEADGENMMSARKDGVIGVY